MMLVRNMRIPPMPLGLRVCRSLPGVFVRLVAWLIWRLAHRADAFRPQGVQIIGGWWGVVGVHVHAGVGGTYRSCMSFSNDNDS